MVQESAHPNHSSREETGDKHWTAVLLLVTPLATPAGIRGQQKPMWPTQVSLPRPREGQKVRNRLGVEQKISRAVTIIPILQIRKLRGK